MKQYQLLKLVLWVIAIAGVSQSAAAQSFGTKFACCSVENNSCLGSGTSVTYKRTLRDRALTQVDAQIRCGTQHLVWASHECPADKTCGSPHPRPSRTSYVWNTANGQFYCKTERPFRKVPNSYCGKPSRYIEVQNSYCHVWVDGSPKGTLNRGQEDCPASTNGSGPTVLPAGYQWKADFYYCYTMQPTFQKVANSFCGKPARFIDVTASGCFVTENGDNMKFLARGSEDCPQ